MTFTEVKEQILEVSDSKQKLTLAEFLRLSVLDESFELVDGKATELLDLFSA
ncbi:hypothetical protein TUMEXPCC7403_09720 [Tumidithrix helvetica PCC 7403]|uniref:hypothetical protein n=1 Tax=Tumidithrix helvetica TaxID=3457545 RepID=UPI003CB1B144